MPVLAYAPCEALSPPSRSNIYPRRYRYTHGPTLWVCRLASLAAEITCVYIFGERLDDTYTKSLSMLSHATPQALKTFYGKKIAQIARFILIAAPSPRARLAPHYGPQRARGQAAPKTVPVPIVQLAGWSGASSHRPSPSRPPSSAACAGIRGRTSACARSTSGNTTGLRVGSTTVVDAAEIWSRPFRGKELAHSWRADTDARRSATHGCMRVAVCTR